MPTAFFREGRGFTEAGSDSLTGRIGLMQELTARFMGVDPESGSTDTSADFAKFELLGYSGILASDPTDLLEVPWDSVTSVLLRATNRIDPQISATPSDDDIVWGISLFLDGNQLRMSWGNMRWDGRQDVDDGPFATSPRSELWATQPIHENPRNIAFLTAVDSGAGASPALGTDPIAGLGSGESHAYAVSLTNRGFALAVYNEQRVNNFQHFGFVVMQRPSRSDGTTLTTGKAPVFSVFNNLDFLNQGHTEVQPRWYKSVVQQADVKYAAGSKVSMPTMSDTSTSIENFPHLRPDLYSLIDLAGPHTLHAWPTDWEQPITQDNNEIPLVFPFGLATGRFTYLQEMDMACVGPSCVFTFEQEIDLTVFGESRKYKVFNESDECNGVVVAILRDGPEFTI